MAGHVALTWSDECWSSEVDRIKPKVEASNVLWDKSGHGSAGNVGRNSQYIKMF